MATVAILDGTTMSIIELIRDIWSSNACVKFEERSLNPSKIIALTMKLCGGDECDGYVADENIIFPETYVSREYNNVLLVYLSAVYVIFKNPHPPTIFLCRNVFMQTEREVKTNKSNIKFIF